MQRVGRFGVDAVDGPSIGHLRLHDKPFAEATSQISQRLCGEGSGIQVHRRPHLATIPRGRRVDVHFQGPLHAKHLERHLLRTSRSSAAAATADCRASTAVRCRSSSGPGTTSDMVPWRQNTSRGRKAGSATRVRVQRAHCRELQRGMHARQPLGKLHAHVLAATIFARHRTPVHVHVAQPDRRDLDFGIDVQSQLRQRFAMDLQADVAGDVQSIVGQSIRRVLLDTDKLLSRWSI